MPPTQHIVDFFVGAVASGFFLIVAPAVSALLSLRNDPRRDLIVPMAFVGSAVFFLASSALLLFAKPSLVILLAAGTISVSSVFLVKRFLLSNDQPPAKPLAELPRNLLILALVGVAVILSLDGFIILTQNWGDIGAPAYVRSPFQLDPVRNTDIVTALMRGSHSLFIPNGWLAYQLFWHNAIAVILKPVAFMSGTRWYLVMGAVQTSSSLLIIALFWSLFLAVGAHRGIYLATFTLLLLFGLDGSLSNFGIHSAAHEYFSPALLRLTAPQHGLCLTLLIIMAHLGFSSLDRKSLFWLRIFFGGLAIAASPPLAATIYPFYYVFRFIANILRRKSPLSLIAESLGVAIFAAIVFSASTGISLITHFNREDTQSTFVPTGNIRRFDTLAIWPDANGAIGVCASLALCLVLWKLISDQIGRRPPSPPLDHIAVILLASLTALLFWTYAVSTLELRRHAAIATSCLSSLIVAMLVGIFPFNIARIAFVPLIPILVVTHFAFLRDFTELPSTLNPLLPWKDYFCAGREVAHISKPALIAASGDGSVLSVVNEFATTLAPRLAIVVHQVTNENIRRQMNIAFGAKHGPYLANEMTTPFVDQLKDLGFVGAVWGPVERAAWGPEVERNVVSSGVLVADCGEVKLYAYKNANKTDGKPYE